MERERGVFLGESDNGFDEQAMLKELAAGQSRTSLVQSLQENDYLPMDQLDAAVETLGTVVHDARAIHHYGDAPYELYQRLREVQES